MPANSKSKNLTVRFLADTSEYKKAVSGMKSEVRNFSQAGKKNAQAMAGKKGFFGGVTAGATKATESMGSSGLSGALVSLGPQAAALAGAIALTVASFTSVIKAGSQAEDNIVKMGVLFKNEAKGYEQFKKSIDYSLITPFDPQDVVPAAVVAGQYGYDAFVKSFSVKSANGKNMQRKVMDTIADMAAFSGQSMEVAATTLFRGDLALLDKYGKTGREAYKKALKVGEVGSAQFVEAFVKNMSEVDTWMGMAEKRSKTISGLWSSIVGYVRLVPLFFSGADKGDKANTLWNNLRYILQDVLATLEAAKPYIEDIAVKLGGYVGSLFKAIWDVLKMIWTAIKPIAGPLMYLWWKHLQGVLWVFTAILKAVSWVANGIASIFKGIYDFIWGHFEKPIKSLMTWLNNLWLKMLMIGTQTWAMMNLYFEKFVNWIKTIPGLVSDMWKSIMPIHGKEDAETFFMGRPSKTRNSKNSKAVDFFGVTPTSSRGNTIITNNNISVSMNPETQGKRNIEDMNFSGQPLSMFGNMFNMEPAR